MFNNSKYTTWYNNIISNALTRVKPLEYTEKHHIIPKSIGGSNQRSNLVSLYPREHFLVHWLLIKMTSGENQKKMIIAFHFLTGRKKYKKNSRTYTNLKLANSKILSELNSGEKNYFYNKRQSGSQNYFFGKRFYGETNPFFGKNHTEETKNKIRNSKLGKKLNACAYNKLKQYSNLDETKQRLSHNMKEMWKTASPEKLKIMKQKAKKTWNDKPIIECPHCHVTGKHAGNMTRYHFNNCRSLQLFKNNG